ncbi:tRNA preQ1(34) S-adenosylmethionine ribosyltransferase-isomerase QueA [Acidaminobacter sp. JC074]|uniref:tRNA preQ1(34) S-adenosylmethionine ribosyltransferase-isomerase QueA n=1 Tax=Acidaminobacter sp. JC074 TaxID=2530199 RepID=UPI001F0F746D|nr:tRNA preQ1(34) S-adenosylmethionine ribosyltransferase-isomerase QueA [Acidaminobacter sp. JC074]MCH4888312.1 tRNA preQ1(34) S-adenosylmethionine ribosyltransferase-isomerase QueA [Acidaminobacter sp. JC074]
MRTKDFYFDLPDEQIAQTPLEKRDQSKLMYLNKVSGAIEHHIFADVLDLLNPGDCLVLNNTRVLPARIFGVKETGATVEFLLLKQTEKDVWECLVKPGKKAKIGSSFTFGQGLMTGEVVDITDEGSRMVKFFYEGVFENVLEEVGTMPLPPYITETLDDQERYQTVYSKHNGSAAAPTAGLHFTEDLMNKIKEKGIHIAYVTLHVGLGTFRPVKVDDVLEHKMHSEFYMMDDENADIILNAKKNGGRIISVGTTSTRTLESVMQQHGTLKECSGWTEIFIYPGYDFKIIDGLITNFHLPESTLIMLVSAFSDREKVLHAYETAVKEKYRFFSFGDAMILL